MFATNSKTATSTIGWSLVLRPSPSSIWIAFKGEDWKLQIARHYYEADSGVTQPPVQDEPFEVGDAKLEWNYFRCDDDHFVDCTAFYHTCHYLRSWAYSQVVSPSAQDVTCVLTTNGPADVWLNGKHVHRQEHFHHQIPHSVSFQARLIKGHNEFLVRFEEVAARECPFAMALQIVGLGAGSVRVRPHLSRGRGSPPDRRKRHRGGLSGSGCVRVGRRDHGALAQGHGGIGRTDGSSSAAGGLDLFRRAPDRLGRSQRAAWRCPIRFRKARSRSC